MDAADDRDQVVGADVLEDERGRAGLDRLEELVLVLGDGEGDDARAGHLALDALGRLDAARGGQRQVEQDDVGSYCSTAMSNAPRRVLGLADDVEVRLALEDLAHAHAEQRVVVDQQDLGALVRVAPVGAAAPAIRAAVIGSIIFLDSSLPLGRSSAARACRRRDWFGWPVVSRADLTARA